MFIKQEWQVKRGVNNELKKRGFKKLGSTGVRMGESLFPHPDRNWFLKASSLSTGCMNRRGV